MSPVFACASRYTCLECVSHQNRIALFSSHFEVPPQRSVPSSSSRRREYGGEKREKTRCDWFNDSVEKGGLEGEEVERGADRRVGEENRLLHRRH